MQPDERPAGDGPTGGLAGASRIFQALLDVWGAGEGDQLPNLLDPSYRGHMLYLEQGERDAAGYLAHIQRYHANNPMVQWAVEDQFGSGDRLCTRLSARRADPVTGEPQMCHGINISSYVNGLLTEEWAVWSPWRSAPAE